jgi:DNA invertase Pin-like site-specific DNA recombinase
MLQQMAAVAELEAGFISDRTKRALAAAKARGKRLGGNRGVVLTRAARKAGREVQSARADARAADLAPVLQELREAGITSLAATARVLTERRIPAARGGSRWTAAQVARTLARLS